MGQKKPRRRTPLILCFSKRTLNQIECGGFPVAVPNHPVFYKYEADVVFIGSVEPLFQPQAVVTGVHIAASGALNKLGIFEQVFERY